MNRIQKLFTKFKVNKERYTYTSRNIIKYKTHKRLRTQLNEIKKRSATSQELALKTFHRDFLLTKNQSLSPKTINYDEEDSRHRKMFSTTTFITKTEATRNHLYLSSSGEKSRRNCLSPHSRKIESNYLKFNDNLKLALKTIECKKSIMSFKEKTTVARKMLIQRQTLKELKNSKIDNEALKVEDVVRRMYTLTQTKEALNEYNTTLAQYVSWLNNRVEKEKKISTDLQYYRSELEANINTLRKKIEKNKKNLNLYKQYKEFLLLVKYKKPSVDKLPMNILLEYGLTEFIKKDEPVTKPSSKEQGAVRRGTRLSVSMGRKKSVMFGTIPKRRETLKVVHEEGVPINKPVFESADEFIDYFKNFEEKTFELFKQLNKKTYKLKSISYEKEELQRIFKLTENHNSLNNAQLETELNHIIEDYEALSATYNNLYKTEKNEAKLSNKISTRIRKILLNLPINVEIDFNCTNFYKYLNAKGEFIFVNGKNFNKNMYLLDVLEKVVIFYIEAIEECKKNPKNERLYIHLLSDLAKKKKYENNKRKQMEEFEHRQKVNQEIISKINKVLFLPRKKVEDKGLVLLVNPKLKPHMSRNREIENDENKVYKMYLTY